MRQRDMSLKGKSFVLAVLAMLVLLWMCFYYVRIGSSVENRSLSFDATPVSSQSLSLDELLGRDTRYRRHMPQNRHPLAQTNHLMDSSDEQEYGRGKPDSSRIDKTSTPAPSSFSSEGLFKPERDVRRGKEMRTPGEKQSNGNGDAWNEELDNLTEELIGEVLEELKKVQNVTRQRSSVADTRVQTLPGETSVSSCNESNDSKARLKFFGQALHSFVLFSAYRFSFNEFVVVGLVSVHLREKNGEPISSCAWRPEKQIIGEDVLFTSNNSSSVQMGNTNLFYVNETLESDYDVIVCKCTFEDPVGANAGGGFLYLNATSPALGFEHVQVLHELPDEFLAIPFEGPFQYEYAFCSPPIWGKLRPRYVKEWLMYHHSVWEGKVHYFMYDAGGIDLEIQSIFHPLISDGLMTVINIAEARKFPSFYNGQHLAINDCLQRARFMAKWLFFWDLDEYLQIMPPATLPRIVEENENALWISFGHLVWSRAYCVPEGKINEWAVERMAFHLQHLTCGDSLRSLACHGQEGLRKWAANPRAVFVATVHRTLEPEWLGVVLNASVARINHYSGLVSGNDDTNCLIAKNLDEVADSAALDGWWWKDTSMSENSKIAHTSSQFLPIFNPSFPSETNDNVTNVDGS